MSAAFEPLASPVPQLDAGPDAVFFVGDSITLGWRDEEVRGWPVRVIAGLRPRRAITAYNLGVRGDASDNILARWQDEVRRRRRPKTSAVLVFAFGANDAKLDADGKPLISVDALRHNTRRILGEAIRDHRVLFVGPAPVDEETLARVLNPAGDVPMPSNRQIAVVSEALAGEAATAGVPYLDMRERLAGDQSWSAAVRETDGLHPPSRGYDIIAGHVAAWSPWASLFAQG